MALPSSASATYAGNGTTQAVDLGFRPSFVKIYQETDNDESAEHVDGQPADSVYAYAAALSFISSNGVTLSATGFSVGSSTSVNESGKTYRWVAFR